MIKRRIKSYYHVVVLGTYKDFQVSPRIQTHGDTCVTGPGKVPNETTDLLRISNKSILLFIFTFLLRLIVYPWSKILSCPM